jgi:hypothetical protein
MPSFSLFQYAPIALCMPLRPAEPSPAATPLGRICWMMVELTAYLKGGWPLGPLEVSEIRALRTAFCGVGC